MALFLLHNFQSYRVGVRKWNVFFAKKKDKGNDRNFLEKGDILLEFSSVKWDLNEDHTLYCNVLGTLL